MATKDLLRIIAEKNTEILKLNKLLLSASKDVSNLEDEKYRAQQIARLKASVFRCTLDELDDTRAQLVAVREQFAELREQTTKVAYLLKVKDEIISRLHDKVTCLEQERWAQQDQDEAWIRDYIAQYDNETEQVLMAQHIADEEEAETIHEQV